MYNRCNPCACCNRKMSSTSVLVNGEGATATVQITVAFDGTLKEETKYCLILAQPCPVAGYNLPAELVVGGEVIPLKKYRDLCNVEYGQDLPKCRNRIPLYYTNGGDFLDMRDEERRCYCR